MIKSKTIRFVLVAMFFIDLLNAFDNKKYNVKTSEKYLGRIPSRDEAKLFLVKKIHHQSLFTSNLELLKLKLIKKILFLA